MSNRPNLSKSVFYAALALIVLGVPFLAGLYSAFYETAPFRAVKGIKDQVDLVRQEWSTIRKSEPTHFLQPSKHVGTGLTLNETVDDDLIMMAGFFDGNNGIRLLRRDGTVVNAWTTSFTSIFPNTEGLDQVPATDWNLDLHGTLLLPDGSAVFNFEGIAAVKMSRCGDTVWRLKHQIHHSIERAETGGFWALGTEIMQPMKDGKFNNPFPPFTDRQGWDEGGYINDLILRISDDGEILESASVMQILYDSGLETLLTSTGELFDWQGNWDSELVHSNKVAELSSADAANFPEFEAGDLLVSVRNYNLLVVVDPKTWRVKWHQVGPWRRQHDPEFTSDGAITVFNNNAYQTAHGPYSQQMPGTPHFSTIERHSFQTGETTTAYGGTPDTHFLSIIRGKHDPVPNGGFLITEFEAGRVFQVDLDGKIVWEYINRHDDDFVLEITEARRYPADYFTVSDWSCPQNE